MFPQTTPRETGRLRAPCDDRAVALFDLVAVSVEGDDGPILDDVTLAIPESGITVVVGPSGAGKTTLLRLLNRLDVPTTGAVRFRGDDLGDLDPLWLRRHAGMVFQRPALFGGTVRDNLLVAAPDGDDGGFGRALEGAELPPVILDRPAGDLSGGEAQRVCLARTLLTEPEVLLMDEPTSALDARPRLALERLTRSLADGGVPVVWVTHQLDQMRRLADHVVVLVDGRVRFSGTPVDLARDTDPEVAAFSGEHHGG